MRDIVWQPQNIKQTNMWSFMQFCGTKHQVAFDKYHSFHQWSVTNPALFWQCLAEYFAIHWDTNPETILNKYQHMLDARWFSGASFNFASNLLSRRDEKTALVSVNEDNQVHRLSYKELYHQVAQCVAGLKALNISAGDRVAAVMPNTAQTIIAMLACASIGAVWSSCSPDFGAQAALDRLGQIEPKLLFICDGHQYQGKKYDGSDKIHTLMDAMPTLAKIVVCPNISTHNPGVKNNHKLVYWDAFIKPSEQIPFASLPFDHPLYILFSSGTTGKPKCIVHGAGGTLLQHLKELALHTDLSDKDTMLFYTTCGWMMWNWMISALALGTTLILYEGAPAHPNSLRLFELVDSHQVTVLGTSAKFISAVEKSGLKPQQELSLKTLRTILSTGSPLLGPNYDFVYQQIKSDVQLASISGGTDIVSCFALGNPILPIYKGELQCIGLGMDVAVFNEKGQSVIEERGELVCLTPFPSMPVGFWNDPEKKAYKNAYFERFPPVWAHGDFAQITNHHGLIIFGRSDAVLNPGGVRIGTAEIYRQVEKIPEVIDSVVIGQNWHDDVRVVLFVRLKNGLQLDDTLTDRIKTIIKTNASPRHVPAKILQVDDIPRTLSGKIVELAVRQVVHNQEIKNLDSLANPGALEYFKNRGELTF